MPYMEAKPFITVASIPDAGMLLGTHGSREILDEINSRFSNTGVVFGSGIDPLADCYREFRNTHVNLARDTVNLLEKAGAIIGMANESVIELRTEEDLVVIPTCMYLPILTYQPVRELFKKESIFGFGVDPELVADYDPYDHVIKNGLIETGIDGKWPETYEWEWESEDPYLSVEERVKLLESRRYISAYIMRQINEGTLRDPTDLLAGGTIGELIE
jgi:hypothetical protein